MQGPTHVAMIGPDLDAQGGIATVARTWLGARAMEGVRVDYVGTMREAPAARKAAIVAARQARFVARLATGWRPELFHVHLSYFSSFYRKLAYFEEALATGRPVVAHIHAPDLAAFHDASRVHAAAMSWMFRRAARVVVLSRAMAGQVRAWTGDSARLEVLYNPVDLARFACPPRPPTSTPTVLFMGELGDRKGTWDLVATIPRVLERTPGARFRFGGNGDIDRLRAEAARLGVTDRVEVLGWVTGDELVRQYAGSDVYCLPSYSEGLPMSILEAMGATLPVVATPIAGVPEAVDEGVTGLLVEPGDRDALADRLARLLADPALRSAMGSAGRRLAEQRFDVEILVADLRRIWAEVLAERTQPENT